MPKGVYKERKLPAVGSTFDRNFKGMVYTLTVVEDGGIIKYAIEKDIFKTPSAAAQSLVKHKYEVNGWVFWGMKNY
ncbi:hypothetical protein [Desulfobacula sp.]|jgi:hypothetical protein|uniref:hypothetical protein n=1 Tax=Desulfobacula sp. TaxID=2593537 RepID=UPI0039B990FA|nr:hypothetical protein [Desulfobacula sp.]MBT7628746.1 hypothetical protein [Desulfobacula sp.]